MLAFLKRPILICATLSIAGCANQKADLPINPANFKAPDRSVSAPVAPDYRLGQFDKFRVVVFHVPDLSGEYVMDPTGDIMFPLIGNVTVQGMTAPQLARTLKERYSRSYLNSPDVSVQILVPNGLDVTVEGGVINPVVYQLVGESNLLQAIAQAKGPNEFAQKHRVVIFRKIDGVTKAAAFDLQRISAGLDPNPTIYGGDIIVVDSSAFKKAFQDILRAVPLVTLFRPAGF